MENENTVNILIVDDNAALRKALTLYLRDDGYIVTDVGTIALGKAAAESKFYNLALIDINLPDGLGIDLLKEIKKINNETLVIMFTAAASLETSIAALNEGAFAYLQKPFALAELKSAIQKALKIQNSLFYNQDLLNKLQELGLKDIYTGLYNHKYLMERLSLELKRTKRYNYPFSIIMLDIDHFHLINETYDHEYGDKILKEFAKFLQDFVRGSDTVIRYGGEKFTIFLSDTDKKGSIIFRDHLLRVLAKQVFDAHKNKINLSISVGIASFPDDIKQTENALDILNLADKNLMKAKLEANKLAFHF